MTAASYWSLLAPAIEMAESSGNYGANGEWAFIPVAVGFALGAAFVYGADVLLPHLVSSQQHQWPLVKLAAAGSLPLSPTHPPEFGMHTVYKQSTFSR